MRLAEHLPGKGRVLLYLFVLWGVVVVVQFPDRVTRALFPSTRLAPAMPGDSAARQQERELLFVGRDLRALASTTADGEAWRLADHAGQVVVLDFWATWCVPCIEKLPELMAVQRELAREPDVVWIGVALDADLDPVLEFTRQQGMSWPQLHEPRVDRPLGQWHHSVARAVGVLGIPDLSVVDRSGRLVAVNVALDDVAEVVATELGR